MPINKEQFEEIQKAFIENDKTDFYSTSPYAGGRTYYYISDYKDMSKYDNLFEQMKFDKLIYNEHQEVISAIRDNQEVPVKVALQEFANLLNQNQFPNDSNIQLATCEYRYGALEIHIKGAGYKYTEDDEQNKYCYYSTSGGNKHGVYQNDDEEYFAFYSGARSRVYDFLKMLENFNVIPSKPQEPRELNVIKDENGQYKAELNPNYQEELKEYHKLKDEYEKLNIPHSLPVIVEHSNAPSDMFWHENQAAYLIRKNDIELLKENILKTATPDFFFELVKLNLADKNNFEEFNDNNYIWANSNYLGLGENLTSAVIVVTANNDMLRSDFIKEMRQEILQDIELNNHFVKNEIFIDVMRLYEKYYSTEGNYYYERPQLTRDEFNAIAYIADKLGYDKWLEINNRINDNNLSDNTTFLKETLSQLNVNYPSNEFERLEEKVSQ